MSTPPEVKPVQYHLTDENLVRVRSAILTKRQALAANRDLFDQWLSQKTNEYQHLWKWRPDSRLQSA